MNVYPIILGNGITWKLFSEKLSPVEGNYVARILFEVREVFIETFGPHIVNSHPVLGVLPTCGDPQTERPNSIIFLSEKASQCIQYIYQFAHELCHFMVPGDVCQSYRWLEETLCQMMSWYAMKFLYCSRSNRTTYLYRGLYAAIPCFIARNQSDRTIIKDMSLSDFVSSNLAYLRVQCYDRTMNRAIAYEMYPLFLETPSLWRMVPSLHTLTDDMPLKEALTCLWRTLNVEKSRWDKLTQRLTE